MKIKNIISLCVLIFIASCSSVKNISNSNYTGNENSTGKDISNNNSQNKVELSLIKNFCREQEVAKGLKIASSQYTNYKEEESYWNIVGSCFLVDLRIAKARLFFLRALEEKKNYAPALNNLGIVYWQLGKHYEALSYFKRAEQEDASNQVIAYNLARVYQHFGLHLKSSDYWSKVTNSKLNISDFNNMASNLVMIQKNKEAIQFFQKTKQSSDTHIALYAVALLKDGQKEEALTQWKQVKAPDGSLLSIYWQLSGGEL